VDPLVFFAFCVIDYSNYVVGLYVIQRNGANMMTIAGAVSLPIAQVVFTLPIMGYFTETFRVTGRARALGEFTYAACNAAGAAV